MIYSVRKDADVFLTRFSPLLMQEIVKREANAIFLSKTSVQSSLKILTPPKDVV